MIPLSGSNHRGRQSIASVVETSMLYLRTTMLYALLSFAVLGCKDAKKVINQSKEEYQAVGEIAGSVADMCASLSTNDFAKAKEIGAKIDQLLSTRVLSWCVKILATEHKEGVDAAKALINELKMSEAITENELAALAEIEKYFHRKGDQSSGDVLILVSALAVEQKYGHGAGGIVLSLRERFRDSLGTPVLPQTNAAKGTTPSL